MESVAADSSTNPGALVVHESTFTLPDRFRFNVGSTADSAGGVTLAQEVPTRTASAIMAAGSFALRLNNTKLASWLMSPPAELVNVGAGAFARPKVEAGGLIHICATSSFVVAELNV